MHGEPSAAIDRAARAALLALSAFPGIGPAILLSTMFDPGPVPTFELVRRGRARSVPAIVAGLSKRKGYEELIARMEAAATTLDPVAMLERHEAAGIQVIALGDSAYPARLIEDPAPPALLHVRGALDVLNGPTVAIVGTRNATRLGCDTAAGLASDLASCGVGIVSGLALGIDGAAHRALVTPKSGVDLVGRGRPIGVVAAGLDRPYPRRHRLLHEQVAQGGVLVCEAPLGMAPVAWRFPARNRIIAGLADAVVVVESRSKGGSILTANEAVLRDRTVLAVPGHPTAPASAGALDLIADGAVPMRDLEDVLVAIGMGGRAKDVTDRTGAKVERTRSAMEELALAELQRGPRTLAELVLATGRELEDVGAALLSLEAHGDIARSGSWFEARGAARSREVSR